MVENRKHEIIEINETGELVDSYFIRRGIIFSRDCDNNRLNVWIEGTLFENLEIFYHCENETESTPDKAFDLFKVGRKVLVLHKFIYCEVDDKKTKKIERIERTVIGLKYNSPEGIGNLQPCVVKRFFVKVKKEVDGVPIYSYYWICFDDENNITTIEINDNEDKTETEVSNGIGFFNELESALYLGVPSNPLTHSATKSFMMTNDNDFRERWAATPCSLFKEQQKVINVVPARWTSPPPCDLEDIPCPPNRFYCNIEKRILVWYGAYEKFIGATVIRFDTDAEYTWNCVAASGSLIEGGELGDYKTLADTEWDIPLNMISGVNYVNDSEISFYLPFGANRRPGQVTIDWVDYAWGSSVNTGITDYTSHWYWSENGFEKKDCASLNQIILDDDIIDKDETFYNTDCPCDSIHTKIECEACSEVIQDTGRYKRTVDTYTGYSSLYTIALLDESVSANTLYRNMQIWEGKIYNAHHCIWNESVQQCYRHSTIGYNAAQRNIGESIKQKHTNGLSACWNSNNVAYFSKEKNRDRCIGTASQLGKTCLTFDSDLCIPWGGPNQADFCNCCWRCDSPDHLCAEDCPGGLGKCFELEMPGGDWSSVTNDYVETIPGPRYHWHKDTTSDGYAEPIVRKFKIDGEIEFDATKIYKTYYLDDRATCHEQGLVIAGKGVEDGKIFWEICHNGINITEKLFKALGCEQTELDEMGLI